jgi:hypothetical protein
MQFLKDSILGTGSPFTLYTVHSHLHSSKIFTSTYPIILYSSGAEAVAAMNRFYFVAGAEFV